jgi:hypothetical protein
MKAFWVVRQGSTGNQKVQSQTLYKAGFQFRIAAKEL